MVIHGIHGNQKYEYARSVKVLIGTSLEQIKIWEFIMSNINKQKYRTIVMRAKLDSNKTYNCTNCGCNLVLHGAYKERLHLHHINPIIEGGKTNWNNLVILCYMCHRKYHTILNIKRAIVIKDRLRALIEQYKYTTIPVNRPPTILEEIRMYLEKQKHLEVVPQEVKG